MLYIEDSNEINTKGWESFNFQKSLYLCSFILGSNHVTFCLY